MIEVQGLVKTFGLRPVLRGLDFRVAAGEAVVVLGPNGAGKTTLLRILASLARPTMGRVQVAGCDVPRHAAQVRQMLGVVSHQPLLYGDLTAEQNLRVYGRLYGVRRMADRVDEVLERVGLNSRRRDLVREFSHGMQQRLAIARAILHDPQVMLLDEPYTGLDEEAAAILDGLLQEVLGRGRAVVLTSHDLDYATKIKGRVDILVRGVIAQSLEGSELGGVRLSQLYRSVVHA